ncbi:DNA topoisomerase III [Puniceicoccales bacterium CK1056]|uniref:DNA topoisomerase n=1 Tax=Oceanipulchritudo coccoides TaxID=2706888 RepID=A0A6B2M5P1_9BACT|nr:DNA topoisomerase [Oceanipulchritudo coccoides]NDV63115.1 DNA topoisomerase III [Oceanipulchritudo coccoides]
MPESKKTLIIAEKPSVAQDISKVLGKFKKVGDAYENDEYVISSAVGHLVELYMPEDINKKEYGFWRLGSLPIIPEKFELKAISDKRSKERFMMLKKLMARKDVGQIYNACDAGREGELIFTYIYELAKCKKPYERVWMQSMTPASIREAFSNLRAPEKMQGLKDAARSRSEADWLIGINGTRAITKRMFGRSKGVATVGRVQTPTLSIVLEREFAIRNFEPRAYWRVEGQFSVTEGTYTGLLQRSDKVNKEDSEDKTDRFWSEEEANALVARLNDLKGGIAHDEKKRTRQSCGRLYDLTSLQREANGRFGYSAARTLQIAQSLYEKHKLLTYPRTDSRALPEDYIPTVKAALGNLTGPISDHAKMVLENDWVKPNKRIFNNAQVSDHFAIVPTGESPKRLSSEEERIFEMVSQRFVAIFFPPAEFDVTTRTTALEDLSFKTEGKVLVKPGYLQVYGKAGTKTEMPALVEADKDPEWLKEANSPDLASAEGFKAQSASIELQEEATKPPARFTEATLLSAMEGAGKLVEDDELADAMKEKGLGTPATRANVIDHLIREKYMEREGRNLLPTTKAEGLWEFLQAVKAEALTQPALTGDWEYQLRQMETGKTTRDQFMGGIIELTKTIVDRVKTFEEDEKAAPDSSVISPTDEKPMKSMLRAFKSQDGELTIYKTISGRKLTEEEVQTLVKERVVGPLDDFRSKAGKPFSALLRLDAMNKVSFDFGDNGTNGNNEDLNLDELPVVGKFKESGATVYETPNAYACQRTLQNEPGDTFRLSRTMLGKTLPREEVVKLLETGKTGLIKGFKSKRTGRLFDAFLFLKPRGGIGFEFPPRKAAAKKTTTKKAAKKD